MKRFWAAAAMLLFITGGCLFNARYARQFTDSLTGQLRQSAQLVRSGEWQQAALLTSHAAAQWEDARFFRCALLSRGDTDHIGRSFCGVLLQLHSRDAAQYSSANAELILQLEALGETEQLSLDNIL